MNEMTSPVFASFRDVIALWASPDAMAADIGAGVPAVRKWSQRDRIPDEWWAAVLATGTAKVKGVTADVLVRLAARDSKASAVAEASA